MHARAVLFDFFGTLVQYQPDRSALAYPATHDMVAGLGYEFDHARFVSDWDAASTELEGAATIDDREFSMTDAARTFADRAELNVSADDADALGSMFVEEWQRHVHPVDGMIELVQELGSTYRLGIVSNTHDARMVPSMLDAFGISDCFDVVVLSVVHGRRKPHPSIYRSALDALRLDPSEVVFVGDSFEADFDAPRRLGLAAFLIAGADSRAPESSRLGAVTDLRSRL